jgi:hypothetical protein
MLPHPPPLHVTAHECPARNTSTTNSTTIITATARERSPVLQKRHHHHQQHQHQQHQHQLRPAAPLHAPQVPARAASPPAHRRVPTLQPLAPVTPPQIRDTSALTLLPREWRGTPASTASTSPAIVSTAVGTPPAPRRPPLPPPPPHPLPRPPAPRFPPPARRSRLTRALGRGRRSGRPSSSCSFPPPRAGTPPPWQTCSTPRRWAGRPR